MRGLWLENGALHLRDDIPNPVVADEALVRVTKAGICSTDTALVNGLYPFTGIIGHEFTGIVEEGPQALKGKRVVGDINAACGECRFCKTGMAKHCENRTVLGIVGRDGAFAERLSLPPENLHVIPDIVDDDAAVFTEPLAAALEILEQVDMGPGDQVLVVGPGKLGQLICRVLALSGASLTVMGRGPEKLERLGDLAVTKTLGDSLPGGFDIAVECTGNQAGFATALAALRPKGTLVLKSTYPGKLTFDATPIVVDEIKIVGSRCGPFEKALDCLASGAIDPTGLIDARYPLGDGLAAFERHTEPGVLKVLLEMG
jgi:threonine dehydrogenase-like Zn-dependent dehydrogenase